jgi:hypothetical protein
MKARKDMTMSIQTTRNLMAVGASATALVATGFLSIPLAHADSCAVNGDYLRLQQHEGPYTTTTSVNAKGSALGPGVVTVPPSGTNGTYGKASGSINGRAISVHIIWDDNKGTADFTGTIGDDGIAHGTSTGTPIPINLWNPGPWDTEAGALNCTNNQGPAGKTATVNSDVDVYDTPGGNGNVIGILRKGKTVNLVGACQKDDWCQVSGGAVPTGNGWVWGALDF